MKTGGKEHLPVGLGCWAIGGEFYDMGAPGGWGDVKDEESLEALDAGISGGATFLDTANIYGAGHSEVLVGKAAKGRRDQVFITTKFGILCDEHTKRTMGEIRGKEDIIRSCEDSLRRLETDYIDLFLFHLGEYPKEKAPEVRDTLDQLVREGKIRYFGWSTSSTERAAVFAESPNCIAVEFAENVLEDNRKMVRFCEEKGLIAICRSPLAMGLLTGKYGRNTVMPKDDLRGENAPAWMEYFINGKPNEEFLERLGRIKDILTSDGRTLAQGCISWILGLGTHCIAIPGFKKVGQVKENIRAAEFGALSENQMRRIDELLGR